MVDLLWVVAGVVGYTLVAYGLRATGNLPSFLRLSGPLTTIRTKRGRALLDWLARPRRVWRAWSNVGVGVTLVVMFGSFVLLVVQGVAILQRPPPPSAANQPRNFLVIPGVNDFLPLSVAPEIVTGLALALIVHEGGHGLLCRVEDIDIESMGLVTLALVPIGAFVEPDEASQRRADRGGRTRMFAAGVTNNFAVAIVAFALLFGPIVGAIAVAPGVAVADAYDGTPAAAAGIGTGDRITAVAGRQVETADELDAALATADDSRVAVELNGDRTVRVDRTAAVVGTVGDNPAGLTIDERGSAFRVVAVNGTPVDTTASFRAAAAQREVVAVELADGRTRTFPAGAFVVPTADGPLAAAGAPTDDPLVVTAIGGERVVSADRLTAVLADTEPGETVTVVTHDDGTRTTYEVTLDEGDDGGGFLGVRVFPGTSGLVFDDFGVQSYPAGTYLALLGGDGGPGVGPDVGPEGPVTLVLVSLVLPLASVVPWLGIPNFPGFTGFRTAFYEVQGPLALLGDGGVFLLANLLFWTAWINLQVGLFNCIPGYPLDGGRILRTSAEAVVSRLPIDDRDRVVTAITTGVGLAMLGGLLAIVFGPTVLN